MTAVAELISSQEYLELERASLTKHEYIAGQMIEMAGASREHNLIVGNVGFVLLGQLRGRPDEVYQNDPITKVSSRKMKKVCG